MKAYEALENIVRKRCVTIFIGALDSIEQKFGYQWGIDKSLRDLNEREKLFYQLWKNLRKEILDKSNNQVKQLLKELDLFDVSLKTYHYQVGVEDE